MSTNRMESFSDGVMAVAITLLVLNIAVPRPHMHHTLAYELLRQWPSDAAYVMHRALSRAPRRDSLWANGS